MAALANAYSKLVSNQADQAGGGQPGPELVRNQGEALAPLRAFANEDIYFFVKRIDNTGLVRQADPAGGVSCWKAIGLAGAAAVLVVGVLLPSGIGLLEGYQLESLKKELASKRAENAQLEVQAERLITPARMHQLAVEQRMSEPDPDRVVYLETPAPTQRSLAQNQNDASQ